MLNVISFIGKGQVLPNRPAPEYRSAEYRFPDGNVRPTTFFGSQLVHHLRDHLAAGESRIRWIVIGTSGSSWSEVVHVLPDQQVKELEDARLAMMGDAEQNRVDVARLEAWEQALRPRLPNWLELRCVLVDQAADGKGQQRLVDALFQHVDNAADVVLDITHAFRHLPVLASFAISAMQWTHSLKSVEMYYGMLEGTPPNEPKPVIRLPMCQRMLELSEAAAVLEISGNYTPLAKWLGKDFSAAWFFENTLQLDRARGKASQRIMQLDREPYAAHPVERRAIDLLKRSVPWLEPNEMPDRYVAAAEKALSYGHHARAVLLLYEAIVARALVLLGREKDIGSPEAGSYVRSKIKSKSKAKSKSETSRKQSPVATFDTIRTIRNACAHGTPAQHPRPAAALRDIEAFRCEMNRAIELYRRLPEVLR